MSRDDLLFSQYDLRRVMEAQQKQMVAEIEALSGDRILREDVERLAKEFATKFTLQPPQLDETKITVDHREVQVDISGDPSRLIFDRSRPFYSAGTQIQFFVPFTGEEDLFKCQPSTYTLNPPRGEVVGRDLVLTYTSFQHDAPATKAEFDRDLGSIKSYLECVAKDVAPHNASLEELAKKRVGMRREKLQKDQGLVTEMGFPARRREGR